MQHWKSGLVLCLSVCLFTFSQTWFGSYFCQFTDFVAFDRLSDHWACMVLSVKWGHAQPYRVVIHRLSSSASESPETLLGWQCFPSPWHKASDLTEGVFVYWIRWPWQGRGLDRGVQYDEEAQGWQEGWVVRVGIFWTSSQHSGQLFTEGQGTWCVRYGNSY